MKLPLTLSLLLTSMTNAYGISGQIDFTQTVSDHAMLIILAMMCIGFLVALAFKLFLEKIDKKNTEIQAAQSIIERNEKDHIKSEVSTMGIKIAALEGRQNSCMSNMPVTYVSRIEYDRFVLEHKSEIQHVSSKMENMIKELKLEIRADLEQQIERILKLLEAKLG